MTAESRAPLARKPELVCPAGSLRALQLAVDAGADVSTFGKIGAVEELGATLTWN